MNPIGGYFELELRKGREYHEAAFRLNTGRNSLELILKVKNYSKVYIPFYACDVILEPFNKLNVEYEYYSIDKNFEPIFNYNTLANNEGFLYINYFGLKDTFISILSLECKNLIIDNSQAFFSAPIPGIPTFYSCRKFFGVPDGAYLYLDGVDPSGLEMDDSFRRIDHLFKRIEYGAEVGFKDFKNSEKKLIGQPIMLMSNLTRSILKNIDYKSIKKRRRENFLFLKDNLGDLNELDLQITEECVPMVFPFLIDKVKLKTKLIGSKIFIATYWTNVIGLAKEDSIEYKYASFGVHLPVDQRYSKSEMNQIVILIRNL